MIAKTLSMLLASALVASASVGAADDHNKGKEETSARALFVLTSHGELGDTGKETGFFLSEATHPYHVLKEKNIAVDFVSPAGGKAPRDGVDMSDPINQKVMEDKAFVNGINKTMTPSEVDPSKYDVIHFVGGHGTMWDLADNEELQKITRTIYENGGVVAAVCHGPVGLVNVKLNDGSYLVSGKKVATFTNSEEKAVGLSETVPFLLESKLRERGAEVVLAENFTENVVVDGRLVTGQNPASATALGEEIAALLKEKSDEKAVTAAKE